MMTYTERARALRPYMTTIRVADGGYLLNSDQFNCTKDAQGKPVFNVNNIGS